MDERRIKIITEYDLKQPTNELAKLEAASKKAEAEVKKIQTAIKGTSDEATKSKLQESLAKTEATAATAEIKKLQDRTNIANMTYGQLNNYVNRLTRELDGTVKGTENYNRAIKQLEPAKKLFNELKAAKQEVGKVTDQNALSMSKFKDIVMGTFGGNLLTGALQTAVNAVKGFFSGSIGSFMDFEVALKAVKAEVEPTTSQMASLKNQAMQIGPQFGKTAKDMMDAYNVVGSGMSSLIETEGALEKVTDAAQRLSIVGEMGLEPAAGLMTSSLQQFNGSAEDSSKFLDIMATGTQVGAAKIGTLTSALRQVGSIAHNSNITFGQTNAALQVLSNNSEEGEKAGTSLRAVILSLATSGRNELNPSIVGLSTALKNLTPIVSDATEMKKMFGKENINAAQYLIKNVDVLDKYTKAIEKGGGAEVMFAEKTDTLKFKLDSAKASITNKAVALGEALAPAIIKTISAGLALIDILIATPKWLNENKVTIIGLGAALVALDLSLAKSNIQLLASSAAAKAKTIWDAAVTTTTNLWTAAQTGLNTAMRNNPIGLVVSVLILLGTALYTAYQKSETFRAAISGLFNLVKTGVQIFIDFHKAILTLDFKKLADTVTGAFTKMKTAYTDGYSKSIQESSAKTTSQVQSDHKKQSESSKASTNAQMQDVAALDGAQSKASENSKKRAEEAKKRAEETKKANEDALKRISEMEADYHISTIRLKDGEYAAEKEKLNQQLIANKKAVEESKALKIHKDKQIELLDKNHKVALEELATKAREKETELVGKWLANESSTKLRKLQETFNKELVEARKHIQDKQQLALVEKQITENLATERQKILDEERAKETKKLTAALDKRLKDEKQVLQAEKTAFDNILKFKELAARGNAAKLVQIARDRSNNEYNFALKALELEYKAEQQKAKTELADKVTQDAKLLQLDKKYASDSEKLSLDHQKKLVKIEEDALAVKAKRRKAAFDGFSALLELDVTKAMEQFSILAKGHTDSIIKISKETKEQIESSAAIANQAISFLNDLYQRQAQARLKSLEKNYNTEMKLLEEAQTLQTKALEDAQNAREALLKQHSDNSAAIKQDENNKIQDLEELFSDMMFEKEEFNHQKYTRKSEELMEKKISNANFTSHEEIRAAANTRDENIIAAEQFLQAFTNHTNARSDLSEQEKQQLIANAQETAASKIQTANDTFNQVKTLTEQELEAQVIAAQEEHDRKMELMEALQAGEEEKAAALIDLAREEKDEKLDIADEEKNKKLQLVEEENQKRLIEKDALDKELAAKEKAYRQEKYKIELDAFKKQQKADIAQAVINGALAAIKALASGMFPVNLVFAAATAVLTGVQVAKIKSQTPPEAPTFAMGTERVSRGSGGIPSGPAHGSRYGQAGIALINRQTGQELGEMEGHEAIIPVSQTRANMPLIRAMLAKARRGDTSPLGGTLPNFRFGGFLLPQAPRIQYTYGTEEFSESSATAGVASVGTSDPSYQEAKAQGEKQLKLLEGVIKAVETLQKESVEVLKFIKDNTAATVSATKSVDNSIRGMDTRGALSAIMDKLRSLK